MCSSDLAGAAKYTDSTVRGQPERIGTMTASASIPISDLSPPPPPNPPLFPPRYHSKKPPFAANSHLSHTSPFRPRVPFSDASRSSHLQNFYGGPRERSRPARTFWVASPSTMQRNARRPPRRTDKRIHSKNMEQQFGPGLPRHIQLNFREWSRIF